MKSWQTGNLCTAGDVCHGILLLQLQVLLFPLEDALGHDLARARHNVAKFELVENFGDGGSRTEAHGL